MYHQDNQIIIDQRLKFGSEIREVGAIYIVASPEINYLKIGKLMTDPFIRERHNPFSPHIRQISNPYISIFTLPKTQASRAEAEVFKRLDKYRIHDITRKRKGEHFKCRYDFAFQVCQYVQQLLIGRSSEDQYSRMVAGFSHKKLDELVIVSEVKMNELFQGGERIRYRYRYHLYDAEFPKVSYDYLSKKEKFLITIEVDLAHGTKKSKRDKLKESLDADQFKHYKKGDFTNMEEGWCTVM